MWHESSTGIDTGMVSTACIDYKIFRIARTLSSPGLLSDGVGHQQSAAAVAYDYVLLLGTLGAEPAGDQIHGGVALRLSF